MGAPLGILPARRANEHFFGSSTRHLNLFPTNSSPKSIEQAINCRFEVASHRSSSFLANRRGGHGKGGKPEALMDMIAPNSKWKASKETAKTLRAQKTWIDTQATGDKLPILPDSRIKICKEIFLPKNHSGQSGWLELCKHFLSDLRSTWSEAETKLGLRYIGVREAEEAKLFKKKLEWENSIVCLQKLAWRRRMPCS